MGMCDIKESEMGVDTRAVCMLGKYFEDFDACLEFLKERGFITEEQVEESQDCGELPEDFALEYQTISCYSEEGGYLGRKITNSTSLHTVHKLADEVRSVVGEDGSVGIHNFVYWY